MKKGSLTLFFVLFLLAQVFAQVTTSGLGGVISDKNETLVGATIQAVHTPSGSTYGTITNHQGRYSLLGLRSGGPYTITISFVGYKSATFENVFLPLGETVTINTQLSEENLALESVVISAKAGFNARQIGASGNIGKAQMESMPTISRSINDFTRLVPQAASTNGGMSFAGSNNRYNSFQIDGAVNNDVFGLSGSGTNGGQSGTQPISLDAIEEVQVVIAPFDVRQSGFTGGGVNAVTKSGTNEIKGSAYFFGNNQNFIGTTPGDVANREKLSKQSDMQYGFTLGAPIVKNKLFFFINGEITDKTYPASNNIYLADELPEDGKIPEGYSGVYKWEADSVINKLKKLSGGYDGGGYGPMDIYTRSYKTLARVDWNINQNHKLTLRHSYVKGEQMNFSRSSNSFRLNDNGYIMNSQTHSLVGELNSTFRNSMNNEFRVGYTRVRDNRDIVGTPFPYIQVKLDNNRSVAMGTENYSAANRLDQDIIAITDNFTWNLGKHLLTFGTHNEMFILENLFIRDNFGKYVYSSLDDFLSIGTATEKVPYSYDYSFSDADRTGSTNWAPNFKALQLGFYVQDQWNIKPNFRLTYGVRMDIPLFLDKPGINEAFNSSDLAQKHNVATNQMPSAKPLFSPRLGFRWNLKEDNSTIIRGGAGIFTGRIPFVWISNSYSNTGLEYVRSQYTSKNMPTDFKFNADPYNQMAGVKQSTSEVNVVAKNFKYPQVFRVNLAAEQDLIWGIRGTIEALYTKKMNDINYKNINIEESGKFLNNQDDKRPLYGKAIDPRFTSVILLDNTSKGYTFNLTGKLEKNFNFGLNAMAAYTYGISKDVNAGTSSQAYSNWNYNEQYMGSNNAELSYSDFDLPHRVIGSISYRKAYAKHFATSVSLIYSGNSGSRYSVVYDGDINGDNVYKNDVMFVPTDAQIDNMKFAVVNAGKPTEITVDAQREMLKSYLANAEGLKDIRGKYAERNGLISKFENHIDLRIMQDFFLNSGKRKHNLQVSLDILNLTNLLNREWGLYQSVGYSYSPLKVEGVDASGVPTFSFKSAPKNNKLYNISDFSSRWRMQLGVRYIF